MDGYNLSGLGEQPVLSTPMPSARAAKRLREKRSREAQLTRAAAIALALLPPHVAVFLGIDKDRQAQALEAMAKLLEV